MIKLGKGFRFIIFYISSPPKHYNEVSRNQFEGVYSEVNKLITGFKVLSFVAAMAMAMSLAACGSNNADNNTPGTGATNNSQEGGANSPAEQPKSDVKLTLWHWKVSFDPGFQAVAEAFKQKTGITVETQATSPEAAYAQKLTASAATKSLPDLWAADASPAFRAFDGQAYEWSAELSGDEAWKSGFLPAALSGVTAVQANVDAWAKDDKASEWQKSIQPGQLYGIPINVGAFYMIYGNKKLVEQAGLEAKTPATFEAWFEMMKTVKDKTGTPAFVFSGNVGGVYNAWFLNLVDYMKNGQESFTKFMNREEKLSDPKHIWALKFIEDLTKEGLLLPGTASLDIDPSDQAFAQGKAAFTLGGTFTYANLTAIGMNGDDVFSFRVPAFEGSAVPDATVSPFPLVQMIVNADGPNRAAAIEFVKFLTSEEGQILYANGAYDLPAVQIKDGSKLNPAINTMASSLSSESNWWSENPAIWQQVFKEDWKVLHAGMVKIMLGTSTAEEAAAEYDKAAEAYKKANS